MRPKIPSGGWNASPKAALASTGLSRLRNPPPHGRRVPAGGIAIPEQQLELVRIQAGGRLGAVLRPPLETALGKPLLAQPESLTVVNQNFQGSAPAAGKDKQRPLQRFALQLLTAKSGQAVDALAKIDRLDGQKNPHLRSDL